MRRIIKIGTSSTLDQAGHINHHRLGIIAQGITRLMDDGDSLALVTSGAVGLGRTLTTGPRSVLAAVGQIALAEAYRTALFPLTVAQLLIDQSHVGESSPAMALQATIHHIWNNHGVPIINENDALSGAGTRIGDNDTLAALVAGLIGADQLVILSDVDGLYTDNPVTNPGATRIRAIPKVGLEHLEQFGAGDPGPWGSGGIISKIRAAHLAQGFGIETLLAAGHDDTVWDNLRGKRYHNFTRFAGAEEASSC